MNPRLVEPGFAVVCLHADVPARPGKDENGEDDAQVARQHGKTSGYLHCQALRKAGTSRHRIELDAFPQLDCPVVAKGVRRRPPASALIRREPVSEAHTDPTRSGSANTRFGGFSPARLRLAAWATAALHRRRQPGRTFIAAA